MEGAVGWTVVFFVGAVGVADDAVAGFEAGDVGTDFDDFAGGVVAEDEGMFDPGERYCS